MRKPAYKAKNGPTSADRAKPAPATPPKPAPRKPVSAAPATPANDNPFAFGDDASEAPKPTKAAAARSPAKKVPPSEEAPLSLDDDDDDNSSASNTRDGQATESLDIDAGFTNKKLMRQVEPELSRGEVLHWAGRMCPEIAQKNARKALITGLVFAGVGVLFSAVAFAVAPWFVGLFPLIFVAIGIGIAVVAPKIAIKQAELGWYAVTNQRALVYIPSAFGSGGETTSYEPNELRRMRVQTSKVVKGAGDLIFKTKITEKRTDYVDRRTRQTVKTETSRSETHFGFLGIPDVREVETLIHNVLLDGNND